MHPVRRRKKRPNYGVRSVDVQRGKNGFGFTISGQQPCILSCIVPGSPAENAGLRAGDYLVAVGGHSVSKMKHNDVVQLIGNTTGILKLQIAENYYSDSSDDDLIAIRHKPKYPHKLKSSHNPRAGAASQNRVAKVVRDLTTGAMFDESLVEVSMCMSNSTPRSTSKSPHKLIKWKAPAHLLPPLPRLYFSEPSVNRTKSEGEEHELFRAIVGYLGTIEMPRKLPPGSRLQIVRGCIKRLRAEKRTHTAVLMTLFTRSLKLQNHTGTTLAIYPGDRVTFCGASSNEDRRHFGVVTTSTGDDPSDSCHVFAVDARPHSEHSFRSLNFKIEWTIDPDSGLCQEFPINSDPILSIIRKFYETPGLDDEELVANSPQPSHDSTTTTSNSDSGIGFRDDSGNQSDRILVVDIQNQRLHVLPNGESPNYPFRERLTVRAMPDPVVASTSNRSCSPISTCSEDPFNLRVSQENMSVSSGKSSRKTPDVSTFDNSKQLDTSMEKAMSPDNTYIFNNIDNHLCSADDMSLGTCSSKSQDAFLSYKLSPKVFGLPSNTSQSLEDLKLHKSSNLSRQDTPKSNSCNLLRTTFIHPAHWGSLQDLRSIANDCYEDSPSMQKTHENSGNGVTSWATSFERLLEDPAGLHTFAEFLKKEFSHENIYFWAACERYRLQENLKKRQEMAREIFDKHLALRAPEPVNVDSQARQVTQEQLDVANQDLFSQAQKQIFNLMKFDSYPRFIKSDLYKECLLCGISGLPVFSPSKLDPALEIHRSSPVTSTPTKLKKSRSDADDRWRKSLLPWSRSRSRCKSRDRATSIAGSTEQDKDTVSTSSSRWSLASWDLALSSTLCRVILPDDATAVVQIKADQTIRQMVTKLLEKRALNYNCFQVFVGQSTKALSLDESASIVGGQELRIEPRVVFRLDLPNKKTIAVKSKQCKTLEEVVRPILNKYGYRFEMCTLCLMSENQVLEPDMAVRTVDNQRLQVLTRSTPIPTTAGWKDCQNQTTTKLKFGPSLDEITNRVFEELLQGKSEKSRIVSDQGSVRSEEWSSEHSSSILGRFMRRDSVSVDKNGEGRQKAKKVSSIEGGEKKISAVSRLPPLIAKWKSSTKPDGPSESDVLYEGLKRAQRSRLEDQRGTEINFELPDFLKDKENAPQGSSKKIRKLRSTDDANDVGCSKVFPAETDSCGGAEQPSSLKLGEVKKVLNTQLGTRYVDTGFIDGILPSPSKAEEYFVNGNNSVVELSSRCKANASPLVQSNGINSTCLNESLLSRLSDVPPPLPPKPKNLSSMNPWPSVSSPPDLKPDLKTCRMRKALYLDQPNGSFV